MSAILWRMRTHCYTKCPWTASCSALLRAVAAALRDAEAARPEWEAIAGLLQQSYADLLASLTIVNARVESRIPNPESAHLRYRRVCPLPFLRAMNAMRRFPFALMVMTP